MTLPFSQQTGPGDEHEEEAEVAVREALPCTDTTDDNNNDCEYVIAMEEEDYCEDKTELVATVPNLKAPHS